MKKKIIALLLVFALLASIVGCTSSNTEVSTEPPLPTAHEEYALAIEPLRAMDAVTLKFSSTESHQVWQDSYLAENEGTVTLEGISGQLLGKAEGFMRFNHEAELKYTELYTDGTSYVTFDGSKVQRECSSEDYLATQYPVVLFDAAHFENGSREEIDGGLRLSFTDATELEDWAAQDYAALLEASAEMIIGANGVESMRYVAKFRQGASDVEITVETGIKVLAGEYPAKGVMAYKINLK